MTCRKLGISGEEEGDAKEEKADGKEEADGMEEEVGDGMEEEAGDLKLQQKGKNERREKGECLRALRRQAGRRKEEGAVRHPPPCRRPACSGCRTRPTSRSRQG